MDNNLNNGSNGYDANDMAVKIAWKKFEGRHPQKALPEWVTKCIRISSTKKSNKWVVKITIIPKVQLKSNQHWEEKKGVPVLVEVDPITEKRWIVMCGGPVVDVEVIFEVEVDVVKGSTTVITDTDLDCLDGTKYELNYR